MPDSQGLTTKCILINFFLAISCRLSYCIYMTTKELIELINSTQDGEIWLYDSKLRNYLGTVEQALEEDLIHFIRADVGNSTTEFIRVSV